VTTLLGGVPENDLQGRFRQWHIVSRSA
jgi:hypothetical protein